jgi:hypothetical protein
MKTVQIYIGRTAIDLDCITVNFVLDGVKHTFTAEKNGTADGKPTYQLTNVDYTIDIQSVEGQWQIQIIWFGDTFTYYSNTDIYYPIIAEWTPFEGSLEFDLLETLECSKLKYERIELFQDEKINVTSSIQNINDISKTFTDFSQSFTIPASVTNNRIFEHFYQNDIDGTIDHNLKRPAYIEIDYIPFRTGVIGLEKANVKSGVADNYQISFYGQLTNMINLFGDTKLNQLDYTEIAFEYSGTKIYNRIIDMATDYAVRYPLISSNRLWSYGNIGTEDITTNGYSIKYNELFPAVKIRSIFKSISEYFGITFNSSFFSDDRFDKCFLLAKNAIVYEFLTEIKDIDFINKGTVLFGLWGYPTNSGTYVDLINNSITLTNFSSEINYHNISLEVTSKSASGTFYVDVFKNGIYWQTLTATTTGFLTPIIVSPVESEQVITFKVKASDSMTLGIEMTYEIYTITEDQYGEQIYPMSQTTITTNSTVLVGNVNVGSSMPDMKVSDFVSGIIKEFNFTCVGISNKVFELLPLEDWYNRGNTIDITKYTDIESIDIAQIPLFNTIEFKHQQSESFVNRNYFKTSNSEYGDTVNTYNYDGQNYLVESPFENLLFARSVDQHGHEAILGYNLNESYNGYIPKPTLLYMYNDSYVLDHSIKFYNGTTNLNIDEYALFGQDRIANDISYSLNFGADNSIIENKTIQNGLFATYYFNYLSNLYNLKQRLTTIKTILPTSLVTNINLNDRLIIGDKRYIINDMKIELTSGEATLSLYNDFRPVQLDNLIILDNTAHSLTFPVYFKNGCYSTANIGTGLSLSSAAYFWLAPDTSVRNLGVGVSGNTTGSQRRFNLRIKYSDNTQINYTIIQQA